MNAMKDIGQGQPVVHDGEEGLPAIAAEASEESHLLIPLEAVQDERRMQVRAYNYWAGLLRGRDYPLIEDLVPEEDADFGPYSVLLDFTAGMENPGIAFLGEKLAEQCEVGRDITGLEQVPPRSLLTRLTDHYMQIFANQAPIGFEAEFIDQRGETVLYRGIMLPFTGTTDTIDFIYGVINWKVVGMAAEQDFVTPQPMALALDLPEADDDEDEEDYGVAQPLFARPSPPVEAPVESVEDAAAEDVYEAEAAGEDWDAAVEAEDSLPALSSEDGMELADWLAEARECADLAKGSEDRSRKALYQAIGRAYDFSLAAVESPEDYDELIQDAGLKVQARAPMTALAKLVFGADYDKTRLTEYATALGHAHRLQLERGSLAGFLSGAEGGLKGVIAAERGLRREESGKSVEPRQEPRPALARKLRDMPPLPFEALAPDGDEFALVLARRLPNGEVALLGEVPRDVPLLERAARKLLD